MTKKQTDKKMSVKDIEKILDKQTQVILSAVDERLTVNKIDILSEMDKKLTKMEMRIDQKFDKLTATLDKFLKRLSDLEDEFAAMKLDINRLKKIIKEKLGVDVI